MVQVGRALKRYFSTLYDVVKANGGVVPAERSRAARVFSLFDWEEISRGLVQGQSIRTIASEIGRSPIDDKPGDRSSRCTWQVSGG